MNERRGTDLFLELSVCTLALTLLVISPAGARDHTRPDAQRQLGLGTYLGHQGGTYTFWIWVADEVDTLDPPSDPDGVEYWVVHSETFDPAAPMLFQRHSDDQFKDCGAFKDWIEAQTGHDRSDLNCFEHTVQYQAGRDDDGPHGDPQLGLGTYLGHHGGIYDTFWTWVFDEVDHADPMNDPSGDEYWVVDDTRFDAAEPMSFREVEFSDNIQECAQLGTCSDFKDCIVEVSSSSKQDLVCFRHDVEYQPDP